MQTLCICHKMWGPSYHQQIRVIWKKLFQEEIFTRNITITSKQSRKSTRLRDGSKIKINGIIVQIDGGRIRKHKVKNTFRSDRIP